MTTEATRNSGSVYTCDSAPSSLPSTLRFSKTLAPTPERERYTHLGDRRVQCQFGHLCYPRCTNTCLLILISQMCAESDVYHALFSPSGQCEVRGYPSIRRSGRHSGSALYRPIPLRQDQLACSRPKDIQSRPNARARARRSAVCDSVHCFFRGLMQRARSCPQIPCRDRGYPISIAGRGTRADVERVCRAPSCP